MAEYRIKEVNGKFVPQVKYANTLWEGINATYGIVVNPLSQYLYCTFSNKEDAEKILNSYKELQTLVED